MADQIIVSFAVPKELKNLLKLWAKEEDRTVSATLRQILEREAQRRRSQGQRSQPTQQHPQ